MGDELQRAKTAISRMLSVRNGKKAVEFYKAAFGANELFRIDDDSRAVVALLSADAGATVVWPVSNQYGWRLGRMVDPRAPLGDGQPLSEGS